MNIRTNELMNQHLTALGYDFMKLHVELPDELEKIVNLEFLTGNDCIILKGLYGNKMTPVFENDKQKCEWEYNETHFHPDEYARTDSEGEYLILALECAKRLANRLSTQFQNKKFHMVVSFDETVIEDGEIDTYGSSTVRFYQLRKGCEDLFRMDRVDKFKHDAVLVIDI